MMKKKNVKLLLSCLPFLVSSVMAHAQNDTPDFFQESQVKYGAGNIIVGSLRTSLVETAKLAPDIVEFSVSLETKGDSFDEASADNIAKMKEFKTFLLSLGIEDKDLTTLSYRNYEKTEYIPAETPPKKVNSTMLSVSLKISKDVFYEVVKLLEKHNITSLVSTDKDKPGYYRFSIAATESDPALSKERVEKQYHEIQSELKKLKITDFSIESYLNNESTEGSARLEKRYYFVQNSLQMKVRNFENIGKIIAKAQSLEMTSNNDFYYRVTDAFQEKIRAEYEAKLLEKLSEKARRLLTSSEYQLGAPKSISFENNMIRFDQPRIRGNFDGGYALKVAEMEVSASDEVAIETPELYEIVLRMDGEFDIIKKTAKDIDLQEKENH